MKVAVGWEVRGLTSSPLTLRVSAAPAGTEVSRKVFTVRSSCPLLKEQMDEAETADGLLVLLTTQVGIPDVTYCMEAGMVTVR